jgi:hypothetical protein
MHAQIGMYLGNLKFYFDGKAEKLEIWQVPLSSIYYLHSKA